MLLLCVLALLACVARVQLVLGSGSIEWKELHCKPPGGCSECRDEETKEPYCADSGFKKLLDCTFAEGGKPGYQDKLSSPYPKDLQPVDGSDNKGDTVQMYRSCTADEVRQHEEAFKHVIEDALAHGARHMSLLHFEMIMFMMFGVALPIVYWRKTRIRHL